MSAPLVERSSRRDAENRGERRGRRGKKGKRFLTTKDTKSTKKSKEQSGRNRKITPSHASRERDCFVFFVRFMVNNGYHSPLNGLRPPSAGR